MQTFIHPRGLRASLLLGTAVLASTSSALSITQSFDYSTPETTSWTKTAVFNKFDATQGTLTSVDFFLSGGITTQIRMSNLSTSSPNAFTGTVTGKFSIFLSPDGTYANRTQTFLEDVATVSKSGSYVKSTTGNPDYTNNRGEVFAPASTSKTISKTFTSANDAASLALMTGLASDKISFRIRTGSSDATNDASGNAFILSDTMGQSAGYVRYNYTPQAVPEPTSIAALGLGALGLVRRRKEVGK